MVRFVLAQLKGIMENFLKDIKINFLFLNKMENLIIIIKFGQDQYFTKLIIMIELFALLPKYLAKFIVFFKIKK